MDAKSITGIYSQPAAPGKPPRLIAMVGHTPSGLSRPEPICVRFEGHKNTLRYNIAKPIRSSAAWPLTSSNRDLIRTPLAGTNRHAGLGSSVLAQELSHIATGGSGERHANLEIYLSLLQKLPCEF
jgi:hypothetical protein